MIAPMRALLLAVVVAASFGCYKKGNVTGPCTVIDLHADWIAKIYAERDNPTTRGPVYWA